MNSRPVTAWLPILGLLAGLACAPSPAAAQPVALRAPEEGQIRALLIGIDAYRHVRPLKGAVSDARDIEGALRRSGINDLTVLVDERANRDAVIGAIEALVQRTARGDLVMISIAGHGAQEPERVKGSQPDGMDTVFLLPGFRHHHGRLAAAHHRDRVQSLPQAVRGARRARAVRRRHLPRRRNDARRRSARRRNELPPGSALSHSERCACPDLDRGRKPS